METDSPRAPSHIILSSSLLSSDQPSLIDMGLLYATRSLLAAFALLPDDEIVIGPLKRYIVGAALSVKRACEILIVGAFVFLWIISPIVVLWLPIFLWQASLWWTLPGYALWWWWDWNASKRGARPSQWLRDNFVWRWFADYFPLKLVKTAELPTDRNYIVGSHPHGVLSIGAFASLLTESTGFSRLFPGITANILTLNGQFWFPLRREFGLILGGCESSRSSLKWLLRNPGQGRAIGLVIGGLNESLMARPYRHDLKLANRRGFCRFALQFGADLVPLYHFGENDLYDQASGNDEQALKAMQARIRSWTGFCPPLPMGRSILNLPWGGILPYRRPVHSVMGGPVRVERVDHPTEEQVDELHERYVAALTHLFETNKGNYGIPEGVHLNLY